MESSLGDKHTVWRQLSTVLGGQAPIYDIAVTPSSTSNPNGSAIFVLSATGVYQADDDLKWAATGRGMQTVQLQRLAVSPNFLQDQTLFAGGSQQALFRSRDGGETWQLMERWPILDVITAIALSPTYQEDKTLFVATLEEGVYLSADDGQSWKSVNFGLPRSPILALALSPNYREDEIAFVATFEGLFWTKNGARAWRPVRKFPSFSPVTIILSPDFVEDRTLFVATEDRGVLVSENGGQTWQTAVDEVEMAISDLVISPSFHLDQTLYAATDEGQIIVSKDRGQHWSPAGGGTLPSVTTLRIMPGSPSRGYALVAASLDGGLWVSSDRAQSWRETGHEIGLQPVSQLAATQWLFVLAPEYGLVRKRADDPNWQICCTTDEDELATCVTVSSNFAQKGTIFLGTDKRLLKSSDDGETWAAMQLPIEMPTIRFLRQPPLSSSEDGYQLIWLVSGERQILYSADGGQQWASSSVPGTAPETIIAFDCSPNYDQDRTLVITTWRPQPGTVYGIANVYGTTDQGETWRHFVGTGTPAKWASLTFYQANLGRGVGCAIGLDHRVLLLSSLNAAQGHEVTLGSEDLSILSLKTILGENGDEVFVAGTNQGVFVSFDKGEQWSKHNAGLDDQTIVDLQTSSNIDLSGQAKSLIALSVSGRLWELSLSSLVNE